MIEPELVQTWLAEIFKHEGGYTRNPLDPGNWTGGKRGRGVLKGTKYGIAANTYGHLDIKNLTLKQAAEIYEADYLAPLGAEAFRPAVAFQLLDFAINSGPSRAIKTLQKSIGVLDDGLVGPLTLRALHRLEEYQVVMLLIAERLDFFTRLRAWATFSKGWARRMANNLRFAARCD